jgi:hypothetical protein
MLRFVLAFVVAMMLAPAAQAAPFEDVLPDLRAGDPVAMDGVFSECLRVDPLAPGQIVMCGLGVPDPSCWPWGWCCVPWAPSSGWLSWQLLVADDWSVIASCPPMMGPPPGP